MTYRKKLIEVALPLEAINAASAREKGNPFIKGHPRNQHQWWARRPLAACRAVLFASLVDDPSEHLGEFPTEALQDSERQRLFRVIERLVQWENSNDADVLAEVRAEILKSTNGNPPPVLDPFCGGGSIPIEAERLGLEAYASDLNPVAVLITKALIEIPPKFARQPPINPEARQRHADSGTWTGAAGLAEDVRYYGHWIRAEAEKRIGHLYPKVPVPKEQGGGEATVIAWIWARTVKCPNPACGCQMPLVRSFVLSTKTGKQAWVEPIIDSGASRVRFSIRINAGNPPESPKIGRGAKFKCILCGQPTEEQYIKSEGQAKRMKVQMMAIVAEGHSGRVYLSPTQEGEAVAAQAISKWYPEQELANDPRNLWCIPYGLTTFADLFTPRQLVALTTFSDLVTEAWTRVFNDGTAAGIDITHARAYADAVATYLAFALDKAADYGNSLCTWNPSNLNVAHLFTKQAIPMAWDFAESNPLDGGLSFASLIVGIAETLEKWSGIICGSSKQVDAVTSVNGVDNPLISTDPPYYDNVSYAELSDFFYVWLRRTLSHLYSDLFGTMLVPKAHELIAAPFRHGGKAASQKFFEEGIGSAFANIRVSANPDYPVTIYYAFKQSESDEDKDDEHAVPTIASTGWETMLEGLLNAGFQVTGTWPVRTERTARSVGIGTNALASSIVLVCRPRPEDAPVATRREFVNSLRRELVDALIHMMHGNVAPVDLAQATIGPGMAVYSRYSKVIETDGTPLRVRAALHIINQELDAILSSAEGEYDGDTRFCLAWFEQFGMNAAPFGEADVLARAKDTSVQGLSETGVLEAKAGKVRLLKREELPADWNPKADDRIPIWECTQQLVRALLEQGEGGAARLCAFLGGKAEPARDLAYRLYSLCERKGWSQEALAYNSLVIAWPEITRLASNPNIALPQAGLFAGGEL